MESVSFLPHYLHIFHWELSQSLITSIFSSLLFMVFVFFYLIIYYYHPQSIFVHGVESFIENMTEFFMGVSGGLSYSLVSYVVFVFFYILWINLVGLVGDFFVLVIPSLHQYFRPVSTDIYFNFALAAICVVASIAYGFYRHGLRYIEKYIPYKGMGLVSGNSRISYLFKPVDVIVGLFIGCIEFIGEVAKVLSLSLRLFGNILAGMVLMGMVIYAASNIFQVPALLPLLVFVMELLVSFIQAFVFSMLVLVYFRMSHYGAH